MKHLARIWVMAILALGSATRLYAVPIVYSATDFGDALWDVTLLYQDGSGGSVSGWHVETGGHEGAFRQCRITFNAGGPATVWGFHRCIPFTYDPQTQGAIDWIDYSEYGLFITDFVNSGPAIRQNGVIYIADGLLTTDTSWTYKSLTGLTAADFFVVGGPPSAHPDFSGSALPFEIGFHTGRTTLVDEHGIYLVDVGIDNWTFVVNPVSNPLPSLSTDPADGSTLGFGNVLVGAAATRSIAASNAGESGSSLTGDFSSASAPFGPGTPLAFGPLAQGESANRDYSFSPTVRGTVTQDITVTSDGGNSTVTLSGTGVAPVNQVTYAENDGLTRIGTTNTYSATITNIGDGNLSGLGEPSNLHGTVTVTSGTLEFWTGSIPVNLGDGLSQVVSAAYTPVNHGVDTANVAFAFSNGSDDGANQAQTISTAIDNATGVGPEFSSTYGTGGTVDFGTLMVGANLELPFDVSNITQDGVFDPELTGLTLLMATIDGADASAFYLSGFQLGKVLAEGDPVFQFMVGFNAFGAEGQREATLHITTDQNAAFGDPGTTFDFALAGYVRAQGQGVIPEPATFTLLALSGLALCRRRRTRGRAQIG